jgi:PAS domain S-box-containing protein
VLYEINSIKKYTALMILPNCDINDTYTTNGFNFQYESLFDLSSDLLCIAGHDGYFKKINPAVNHVLCYNMEELYSRPIDDFIYYEDLEITKKCRHELTQSKSLLNFENRYVSKNGEIIWLSWTSHPVESDKLIFAIAKNITHKKNQEAERNALLAKLIKVNSELKQLTYTTSHDLRTPVNNLLAIFGMLDINKIEDLETKELIEILKLASDNLKDTLYNYIDILSDKHKNESNIEKVDLNESFKRVLLSINSIILSSQTKINCDFSKWNTINFNKVYLESVLLNLITNSIKYAKVDCLPKIFIYSEYVNGIPKLIYEDNGMGFDMEKQKDKIFNLHQKFHSHAYSKGIGLYLVYNHVKSLGGDIKVESKLNEGVRFFISFKI